MRKSDASKVAKRAKRMVLTRVEILEAEMPGFSTETRMLLDKGVSPGRAAEILRQRFNVEVTESAISQYRTTRWLPERIERQKQARKIEVVYELAGGDKGLDKLAFARIRELLDTAEIKEANSIRLTMLKIRAQDLKEEEFKFKCNPQGGETQLDGQGEPASEEARTKRVMNKVRAIFALPALPEDPGGTSLRGGAGDCAETKNAR